MAETHKLHVKIGQHEFEAEGQEQVVNEQYEKFLAAVSTSPIQPPSIHTENKVQKVETRDGIAPELLERAFSVDNEGIVSLRVRPNTATRNADALVLILYGFRVLRQSSEVPVLAVMEAARQSGIQIERADRAIAPHNELVIRGGTRRGGRYGLNNAGVVHAENLLREMF